MRNDWLKKKEHREHVEEYLIVERWDVLAVKQYYKLELPDVQPVSCALPEGVWRVNFPEE